MTGRKQVGLGLLVSLVAVGLVTLLRSCSVISEPAPGPLRSVYPWATATPAGYVSGLVGVRSIASGETVTPFPGQSGVHIPQTWSEIQANLTATPNWNMMKTRVAYADSLGLQAWIGIPYHQGAAIYAPTQLPTVTAGGYSAPDYSNALWTTGYANMVASLMTTFGSDVRVAGFAFEAGYNSEVVLAQGGLSSIEALVPCQDYIDWVVAGARAYRDGTNKPVTLAHSIPACANSSYNADRKVSKYLMQLLNMTAPSEYIGYRYNGLAPDENRAWFYGTPVPWGRFQIGATYPDLGGVSFEPKIFPASVPTADRQSHADYMLLNAASANADNVFLQEDWSPYISTRVLNVITQTLGTTAHDSPLAWVWFREGECRRLNVGSGYEYSCVPGPFTHVASVVGSATPTTYCSPNVKATADAMGGLGPPAACQRELSTPAARESRNALSYAASSTVGIDIDDDWVYGGLASNTYSVTLRYLDTGTGTITLAYENMAGVEATQTVTKTNSGAWKTAGLTITAALANGFTTHDVELRTAGDASLLNSLTILYTTAVATPTPTSTPTATVTPSATPTPTSTPTATSEPASVYLNEICPDPGYDANLDGQVEPGDAYVELYSGESANVDLAGWELVLGSDTYVLPTTRLVAGSWKVLYARDLGYSIPVTGTLTLNSLSGAQVDTATWPAQSGTGCYARQTDGGSWASDEVGSMGRAN